MNFLAILLSTQADISDTLLPSEMSDLETRTYRELGTSVWHGFLTPDLLVLQPNRIMTELSEDACLRTLKKGLLQDVDFKQNSWISAFRGPGRVRIGLTCPETVFPAHF